MGFNKTVHHGWTGGQFLDFTPIIMLQITSQRLTSSYENMFTKHFDYLQIDVSFTEQSYPRESSFFPEWDLKYVDGVWARYSPVPT